jgi:hypothetical protein
VAEVKVRAAMRRRNFTVRVILPLSNGRDSDAGPLEVLVRKMRIFRWRLFVECEMKAR